MAMEYTGMGSARHRLWGFLAVLCSTAAWASATEWHVDATAPGGGDGSVSAPFQYIQDGIDNAQPGDVVHVHGGTYSESLTTVRSGSATTPITVSAWADDTVWVSKNSRVLSLQHQHIIVDGINFDGQFTGDDGMVRFHDGSDYSTLRRSEIANAGDHQLWIDADDVLIEDVYVHHAISNYGPLIDAHNIHVTDASSVTIRRTQAAFATGDILHFERDAYPTYDILVEDCDFGIALLDVNTNGVIAGTAITDNVIDIQNSTIDPNAFKEALTIRRCHLYGSFASRSVKGEALDLKHRWRDVHIEGNLLYDNTLAIQMRAPSTDYLIANNLIFGNTQAFEFEDGVGGIEIASNTIYGHAIIQSHTGVLPGLLEWKNNIFLQAEEGEWLGTYDHNLFWLVPASWPASMGNIEADPDLADPNALNFRLAFDSPAVDAGIEVTSVTIDLEGVLRPQGQAYDLGAYERTPGDADNDGDIDLEDVGALVQAIDGPALSNPPVGSSPAGPSDLDGDGDVDLVDFDLLARNFTGPS